MSFSANFLPLYQIAIPTSKIIKITEGITAAMTTAIKLVLDFYTYYTKEGVVLFCSGCGGSVTV